MRDQDAQDLNTVGACRPMMTGPEWDARAEFDVGLLMARYLQINPAPADSEIADDFEIWAGNLERRGRERLQELGLRRLRRVQ